MDGFNRISLTEPNISFAAAELTDNSYRYAKLKWELACSYRRDNIPANNIITNFTMKFLFNPKCLLHCLTAWIMFTISKYKKNITFCPLDLDIDPMASILKLDLDIVKMYVHIENVHSQGI